LLAVVFTAAVVLAAVVAFFAAAVLAVAGVLLPLLSWLLWLRLATLLS
jgi:hypothetical protein